MFKYVCSMIFFFFTPSHSFSHPIDCSTTIWYRVSTIFYLHAIYSLSTVIRLWKLDWICYTFNLLSTRMIWNWAVTFWTKSMHASRTTSIPSRLFCCRIKYIAHLSIRGSLPMKWNWWNVCCSKQPFNATIQMDLNDWTTLSPCCWSIANTILKVNSWAFFSNSKCCWRFFGWQIDLMFVCIGVKSVWMNRCAFGESTKQRICQFPRNSLVMYNF